MVTFPLEHHAVVALDFSAQFHDAEVARFADVFFSFKKDQDGGDVEDGQLATRFGDSFDIDVDHGELGEVFLDQALYLGFEAFAYAAGGG